MIKHKLTEASTQAARGKAGAVTKQELSAAQKEAEAKAATQLQEVTDQVGVRVGAHYSVTA